MSKRFLSGINVTGTATLNTVANAGLDTDKFLVLDAAGNIDFRTGDELKLDIGANVVSRIEHEVKLGETMTIGTPVYIGVDLNAGTNMTVYKATNATEAGSSKTIGLIASSGITNDLVEVVTEGLLEGLNTSTATKGDPVWLGVNGALLFGLSNKPVAPAHMVFLGIVTRVQQNNGEIFVKVQNGFEMSEIHNYLQGNVQNNEVIVYESATSLYKPKSIPTILGYTPVPDSRTLTINGTTYDLSANRAWTITTDASARSILRYVATANQTTFTISGGYTPGLTDVYRNGVKLDNSTDFTATNGTTIVLTNGASVNDVIEVYRYQTAFLANNALRVVTEFIATAGQTTFNVTYNSGLVDVFYNGSKLVSSEFTAGNGTTIVLNFPCNVNDSVAVHAYSYAVGAFTGQAQLNGTGLVRMSGTTVTYDNATYATQSYVTTAVANLVNSAPATLDTLNELATALGNDANFATTVTNSIATKLPLSGGTLTGALNGTTAIFRVSADRNLATRFDTNITLSAQSDSAAPETLRVYADTFRLFTATTAVGLTERLTISNTGAATFSSSVKMGNASAAAISSNATGADVIVGSGTTSSPAFQVWDDNSLTIPRFIVTRGGNVGIGTSSPLSFANVLTVHMNGGSGGSFFTMAGSGTRYMTLVAESTQGKIETNTTIPLVFATNETERMRITSDGYLRLSSKGIQFNGDTSDANSLDDYEEGTWTPTITGSGSNPTINYSAGNTGGIYTKVGNLVTISFEVRWSSLSGGSGAVKIAGLPFTRKATSFPDGDRLIVDSYNNTISGLYIIGNVGNNQNTIGLTIVRSANTTIDLLISDLYTSSIGFLRGTLTYFV